MPGVDEADNLTEIPGFAAKAPDQLSSVPLSANEDHAVRGFATAGRSLASFDDILAIAHRSSPIRRCLGICPLIMRGET